MTRDRTDWTGVAFGVALACLAAYQQFKLPPALPAMLDGYGYDRTIAGAFMSVYAFAGLLLSWPIGRLLHRAGAARLLYAAFAAMLAGNLLVLAWPADSGLVVAARGLEGVAFAICAIAGPTLANLAAARRHAGIVVGLTAAWIPVGQLAAALLAPIALAAGRWQWLWAAAVLATVAMMLWMRALERRQRLDFGGGTPEPSAPAAAGSAQRRRLPLLLAAAIFMLWSGQYFAYMTWLPQYLVAAHGLSEQSAVAGYALPVAVLLLFNLLTGVGLRLGLSVRHLLVAALLSQAAVWWLAPVTGSGTIGVLSLVAYGIGAGITPTCLFALPSVLRGPAGAARAFGALMTGRNLGVLVGPVLFAAASKSAGGWHAAVPLFAAGTTLAVVAALCLFPMLTPRASGEGAQGTRR
ncbi:MAG TPA: MFS transporter [Dongiaceae bacterium]|nr:MFS transporter [Dongiaceae bacterium]